MKNLLIQLFCISCLIGLQTNLSELNAQEISLEVIKQEISCFGINDGRASVLPTGGKEPYNYIWSNNETSQTIIDLAPGTYEVTVMDANGTEAKSAAGLIAIEPLGVQLNAIDGVCGKLGKIETTISGGLGPFQYNWSDGTFGSDARDLEEDTYSVTVTDRNACPITASEQVIVNGDGIVINTDFSIPTCSGNTNGYIAVSQTGGEAPITYLWNDGSTGSSIENLPAGTYSIFAEDAFGCTDGVVIILQDPDQLKAEIINQGNSLFANVTGGTPGFEYKWSNGVTGSTVISNLAAGDYGLTVEDAYGCTANAISEVLTPLSNSSIETIQSFSILPTLVRYNMQVSLVLDNAQLVTYEMFNSAGAIVSSRTTNTSQVNINYPSMSQLTQGTYLLKISSESGWSFSEQFIKL